MCFVSLSFWDGAIAIEDCYCEVEAPAFVGHGDVDVLFVVGVEQAAVAFCVVVVDVTLVERDNALRMLRVTALMKDTYSSHLRRFSSRRR